MKNWTFYRRLHGRGMTLAKLAEELETTPSHLSAVFNGVRGGHTRKHIRKLLTPEERQALGWEPSPTAGVNNVASANMFPVEQTV